MKVLIPLICMLCAVTGLAEEDKKAAAVEAALAFLAAEQKDDGHLQSRPDEPKSLLEFHGEMHLVLTAVSGLAWMAEGSTVEKGKYAENIQACIRYLKTLVADEGQFKLAEYEHKIKKSHIAQEVPFLVCFFIEADRQKKDPVIRKQLQMIADYIVKSQHEEKGRLGIFLCPETRFAYGDHDLESDRPRPFEAGRYESSGCHRGKGFRLSEK